MIGSNFLRRVLVGLAFVGVTGSAAAFSYGILAGGVLVAAIAVVAAPYVGVALTFGQIAGVMGTATVHSALAAYIFGQPVKPSASMPPVMVAMINNSSQTTAKPVKVNLAPMTPSAKAKYSASKQAAAAAATVKPMAGTSASGQGAAESGARSQIQPAFQYYRDFAGDRADVTIECQDDRGAFITCDVVCKIHPFATGWCSPDWKYPTSASVRYTQGKPGVPCPSGSHDVGGSCAVDKDPNADAVVNDGSATPQWNPAGLPDDAVLSSDGSTLSRSSNNGDGTTTTTNVTLQSDGSLDLVDSTFDPQTGKTVHTGYAVDTDGKVQNVGAAVSNGNFSGPPGPGTTFPNGSTPGQGTGGGGGGCGSAEKPNCDINFGTPDAGPAVPQADAGEANAALSTTVFDGLLKFQLPAHASECPTMNVATDYFRKSGVATTRKACELVDANRASLSSIFTLIWAIAALFLILSA